MKLNVFPHNRISPLATRPLALLIACCALAGQTPAARATDSDAVLPPKSHPFGKSYTQWSEEHWQWLYSIPAANHPAFQDGNIDLSAYQPPGHVWFLIGSFSPTPVASGFAANANRTATVPHGKALFFPIIDAEASTAEGNGSTHAELLAVARGFLDPVSGLTCEIDGNPVPHLERYRFETPLFTWGPLPTDNILGLPAGTTTDAVSAGYFIMLAPLSSGPHTVHFAGTSGISPNAFTLDITYHLTVVGSHGANDAADDDD
jgi:hypothetical protein